MRNGPYVLIVAPPDYPGRKYRDRYAYEHIVEFWKKTGALPKPGFVVHHQNDDKHDNAWSNLEEKSNQKHSLDHARRAPPALVPCSWCKALFETIARNYRAKKKAGQERFYCCRSHQVRDQQRILRSNSRVE